MHKFFRILLFLTFLWAITLPWTLSYLSTLTSLSEADAVKIFSRRRDKPSTEEDEKIVIGAVACGEKPLTDIIVLLKSVIITSIFHKVSSLEAILFADDEHLHVLDVQVAELKNFTKGLKFHYEIHPVVFPAKNHDEWSSLFKPCASQRLFLQTALPHISEILYLDVDTLVVGNLKQIWSKFKSMSSEQAVGLVSEHEVPAIAWYNRFAHHPYYPPLGLNTGVMLMNLTRLRLQTAFNWEQSILEAYRTYKDKIVFGDQDLINILFYHHPDVVYLLPCSFNYRTDHCMYGLNCKSAESVKTLDHTGGIQILHGNRNAFRNEKFPLFKQLHEYFSKLQPQDDFLFDVVMPFKLRTTKGELHNSVTQDCDSISNLFFNFLY